MKINFLVTCCWLLAAGYWLLAASRWLIAVAFYLLFFVYCLLLTVYCLLCVLAPLRAFFYPAATDSLSLTFLMKISLMPGMISRSPSTCTSGSRHFSKSLGEWLLSIFTCATL